MSDILNIQPNAGQTPNEDTTFEIEGYANHIQNLEKAYPDEEPVIQPEAGDEFAPLPEAESTPTPPTESDIQAGFNTGASSTIISEDTAFVAAYNHVYKELKDRGLLVLLVSDFDP